MANSQGCRGMSPAAPSSPPVIQDGGAHLPSSLGNTILDDVRSCVIQDGDTRGSWKKEAIVKGGHQSQGQFGHFWCKGEGWKGKGARERDVGLESFHQAGNICGKGQVTGALGLSPRKGEVSH